VHVEDFLRSVLCCAVQAAAAAGAATPEALLQQLVALAPLDSVPSFIAMRFAATSCCSRDRCVPHTVRQQVLRELRATPLHQVIMLLVPLLLSGLLDLQREQPQPWTHTHCCIVHCWPAMLLHCWTSCHREVLGIRSVVW
jgi:hypothetical protein